MLGRNDDCGRTLAYGAAHYGKSLFWYGGEVLFAFFLTEVAGLTPMAMGLVLASGFLTSAAFDLLVGRWMARRDLSVPQIAALQMSGALAAGLVLVGFFATPFLPPSGRLAGALIAGVVFRLMFSIYDVPQGTLMALAVGDDRARARIAGVRIAGSGLASITVAAVVGPLINASGAGNGGALMVVVAGGAALIAGGSAAWLWRRLRTVATDAGRTAFDRDETPAPAGGRLWPLWAMMAVMMLGPPLFQKLEPYFASRAFPSSATGGLIILAVAIGVAAGQPLWLRLGDPPQRQRLFLIAASLQATGAALFVAAPTGSAEALVFAAWLFGLGNGGVGMAKWAAYSNAVACRPSAQHGLCFAAFGAIAKLALALGIFVVAQVIEACSREPAAIRLAMAAGPIAASLLVSLLVLIWLKQTAGASGRGSAAFQHRAESPRPELHPITTREAVLAHGDRTDAPFRTP